MAPQKHGFINVDALMEQVTVTQIADYYGVSLPELHRRINETRSACFLHCGKEEPTGERVLAIQEGQRAKIWRCHQYGCGKGGNLISLCDYLKPGEHQNGKPRGDRFKAIAADLLAMASGERVQVASASKGPSTPVNASRRETNVTDRTDATSASGGNGRGVRPENPTPPPENIPLKDSPNERARALLDLDAKFVTDVSTMPPAASRYFRKRSYLTPEQCARWRMGFLPRDTGGNFTGGTMRGRIVYPYLDENGDVLTWFGRDPSFEEKHNKWIASGRQGKEPAKFHFVKGFHRGNELFGQHRLSNKWVQSGIADMGLIVVEGPNDVIALDAHDIPAVALCSNTITGEQVERIKRHADALCGGRVMLMFDLDPEGERGVRQAAMELLQAGLSVRLAWNTKTRDGRFAGKQPEDLCHEDACELMGVCEGHDEEEG